MGTTEQVDALAPSRKALLTAKYGEIDAAANVNGVVEATCRIVDELLWRPDDVDHRRKTLAATARYFTLVQSDSRLPGEEVLLRLKHFAKEAIKIVIVSHPEIGVAAAPPPSPPPPPPPAPKGAKPAAAPIPGAASAPSPTTVLPAAAELVSREQIAEAFSSNVSAADVEDPTAIHTVPPPPPEEHQSFATLFPAALVYRLRQVTSFFHRRNPTLSRELPVPFLLAPEFDARVEQLIHKVVVPRMYEASRSIGVLENARGWAGVSTASFWDILGEDPKLLDRIMTTWVAVWEGFKQQRVMKERNGEKTVVLVAPKILLEVREALAPASAEEYDLPPLRNREIELLASVMSQFERPQLEYCWNKLRQIYEQEMDRRWYQDKAREGALRDSLLEVFAAFPDRTGEFLALLCYYNFPNINIAFLERFTHNKGINTEERHEKVPYLMRFLSHPNVPAIRQEEVSRDIARREAIKAAKKNASA